LKLTLNLERRRASWEGVEIALRRREFDVLALLFLNFGKVVSREDILSNIYRGGVRPDSRAVDNTVKRLRQKLPAPVIQTEWGVGYRLDEEA
jgi:DNA-binding response OmpR family regulator